MSGDVILAVNDLDVGVLSHKQAQDVIVAAGDSFRMVIQRSVNREQEHTFYLLETSRSSPVLKS